jgi:phosphatidylglycerol:prolipoprotein diacylglycerol transferase
VIAFQLPDGVPVYVFSLLMSLGVLAGLAMIAYQAKGKEIASHINVGLWMMLGGLIGARIAYTVIHWDYFKTHFGQVWQVFLGGLSWPGALVGACLSLFLIAILTRQSLGILADAVLPLVWTVSVSAWLGCWVDGCAYGIPVNGWWGLPGRDEWGIFSARVPVQLIGAVASGVEPQPLEGSRASRQPGAVGFILAAFWSIISAGRLCSCVARIAPG